MSHADAGIYLALLIAGLAVTYVWRLAGVVLVRRIDPHSPILQWVRAVATALVAALVARMIFFPTGLLAHTGLPARLTAMACGILVWRLAARRIEAGVAAAVATFLILQALGSL